MIQITPQPNFQTFADTRSKLRFSSRYTGFYEGGQMHSALPPSDGRQHPESRPTPSWLQRLDIPLPEIPMPSMPWNLGNGPQAPFNFQFQPQQFVQHLQNIPPEQIYRGMSNLSNVSGFLPVVLPNTPFVPVAGPLISTGVAGMDVYRTYKNSLDRYKDLPPEQRWKKTADKTGKRAMYQLLATFVIPAALGRWAYKKLESRLELKKTFNFFRNHPQWYKYGGTAIVLLALSGTINRASDIIADWTWDPLVRRRKPKQWKWLQEKFIAVRDAVVRLMPKKAPLLPRPVTRHDWHEDSPRLHHPAAFQSMFS